MEFVRIRDINDPLAQVIKDDPVRPHIPLEQRVNDCAEILILKAGEEVLAATCMQWLKDIPKDEEDLKSMSGHDVAVFYTIWSYSPGAGQKLLKTAAEWLLKDYADSIKSIVTLSPLTDTARRFHMRNGATVHQENATSTNYKYYEKKHSDVDTEKT